MERKIASPTESRIPDQIAYHIRLLMSPRSNQACQDRVIMYYTGRRKIGSDLEYSVLVSRKVSQLFVSLDRPVTV